MAGSPYVISASLSPTGVSGNYAITYNTANFTIAKATALIVSLGNLVQVYYGDGPNQPPPLHQPAGA